ncbi:MAG: hypothetical protein IJ540_01380 [Prevotella sp.]|nr:hypothetical protein [Prevotella sp.]
MGLMQEIKKEWTWSSIKHSWTDLLSIAPAVFIADGFREKGFFVWTGVWVATYFVSEFILRFIARMIKSKK